jgi:polysaccharide export outer membrane protein
MKDNIRYVASWLMRTAALAGVAWLCLPGYSQGPSGSTGPAISAGAPAEKKALVGPNDTVTIEALNVEEISKAWRVSTAGELSLPMVGRVQAAGLTLDQLENTIEERLRKYVLAPEVTVYVSEARSNPVVVSGGVAAPGILQLQGPTPLYKVVAQAGGLKDAGPNLILSRRKDSGAINHPRARFDQASQTSFLELSADEVSRGHGEAAEILVQSNDAIAVDVGKQQKLVHISGEVNKPGSIELATVNSVSLSKAIAMAGGKTRTASGKKTIIRHTNSLGAETSIAVINLDDILSGKTKDLELIEGDIVIVPTNNFLQYLQTATNSAVSSGIFVLGQL